MRYGIDEVAGRAEAFAIGEICPELLRDLELGIDMDGLLDIDRAVLAVGV